MPDLKTDGGYGAIAEYSRQEIRWPQFDRDVQGELNLFALREDLDLEMLEEILDKIIVYLPQIRRIFSAPIIRLRDSGEILPVEAVRVVNSKTLAHISVHSELWENIKDETLIPRKLMSIRHEDDYALYENIIFVRTVDTILAFIKRNGALLRDMLYANRELHFNLLERENHPSYFLALGKLHTGYLRDYDKYLLPIERCFDKITAIEHCIVPRLSMPVYKKCRKKGTKLGLKRTNIFRSQKDYRKIYALAKYLSDIGIDHALIDEASIPIEDYISYCSMLCVFAASHFNFKFSATQRMDFKNLRAAASFENWKLNIRREGGAIALEVQKDKVYKALLCPMSKTEAKADEIIYADTVGELGIRIDIHDIDSFRRIQQIILRAMIYADTERIICPFCGRELVLSEDGRSYECGACRTVIEKRFCSESGEPFFRTSIKYSGSKKRTKKDYRTAEGLCYYRNITPVNEQGEPLCPHCGKLH